MNPEALNQQTDQAPVIDGRHPFDQGFSTSHLSAVMADIDSRTPKLPELHIEIAEFDQLPVAAVVFDAETITSTVEEQKQQRLIDRARNAWGTHIASIELPQLRFLAGPALALTIAACNTAVVPTETTKSNQTPEPTATQNVVPTPNVETPSPTENQTPSPTATQEATPTPDPMPSAKEVLDTVLNQPNSEIKAVKIDAIKTAMTNLWKNHQASLSILEFSGPTVPFAIYDKSKPDAKYKPTLKSMLDEANKMAKGDPGISGNELIDNRRLNAGGVAVEFVILYRSTKDPSLKADLTPLVDMCYDYGTLIQGRTPYDIRTSREKLNWNMPAYLSWFAQPSSS